jgi:hypothetical protein
MTQTGRLYFEQERARIKNALGSFALTIEHVGSTAVPGLPSKPIIDLLVGVRSLEEARERCIDPIEALGYDYIPEYALWLPGELFFREGSPGPWTHHVHSALLAATTLATVLAAQSGQVFPADFPHDQDYCVHITWKNGRYVCGEGGSRIPLRTRRENTRFCAVRMVDEVS